jgi:FkbM family methyltransferase
MYPKPDEKTRIVDHLDNISSDSSVYVVGAYIGVAACLLADVTPEGQVVAFEPHPNNMRKLRKNVALNNLTNVSVHSIALGDSRQKRQLATQGDGKEPPSNMIETETIGSHSSYSDNDDHFLTRVVPGDEFVERKNLEHPDSIMITAEGSELKIIKGLSETIRSSCDLIYCEVQRGKLLDHGATPSDLHEALENRGFDLSIIRRYRGDDHYILKASR